MKKREREKRKPIEEVNRKKKGRKKQPTKQRVTWRKKERKKERCDGLWKKGGKGGNQ